MQAISNQIITVIISQCKFIMPKALKWSKVCLLSQFFIGIFIKMHKSLVQNSVHQTLSANWEKQSHFMIVPGNSTNSQQIYTGLAYSKPQKAQESYKNFQGRNPYNIFVVILVETMTPKRHFEINRPLVNPKQICPK